MIDAESLGSIASTWLAILICGLLTWPVAALIFPDDADRGYLASKPLGWMIGAYSAWLLSFVGVPFHAFGWVAGLAGLVLTSALALRLGGGRSLPRLRNVVVLEAGFLLLLLGGALIKARWPDIHGLEKFMDFAFVSSALRSATMPPADPWWAGEPINYYYFGHVAAAWLIQLARTPSDHGFNLMIAVVFAFTGSLTYRIVNGTLQSCGRTIAMVCGGAATALVLLGGNFHSVLYGLLRPLSHTTLERGYYYPDSTRFVGFDPPTSDRGFTEMPAYGFAVGDLHAHLLNLPVALLIVLILVRVLVREWSDRAIGGVNRIEVIGLGLLFGVAAMSNSWDAVSYGLLMALVGIALLIRLGRRRPLASLRLMGAGGAVIASAVVLALPFLVGFVPIASTLMWSDVRTPLWQLTVLYGHLIAPAVIVGLGAFRRHADGSWVVAGVLMGLSLLLITIPEIGFVRDIYGEDFRRANTMFKFTFGAQAIGFLASAMVVGMLLADGRWRSGIAAGALSVPLLATLSFAGEIYGKEHTGFNRTTFTMDGFGFFDSELGDDRLILDWLRQLPPDSDVLLVEAPGHSYSNGSRLSALSGLPSVVGWPGHEWLWRGDRTLAFSRHEEIGAFYEQSGRADACRFLETYKATHIAVGSVERAEYPRLSEQTLRNLGDAVVDHDSALLIAVDPDRCEGTP